jgi:hypothetical protein
MSPVNERVFGPPKNLFKVTDSSRSNKIRMNAFGPDLLKSLRSYPNISEFQFSNNFGQKRAFLFIGLNQGYLNCRGGYFECKARKARTCSNVDQSTVFHRQQFRGKHGFPEMAAHNFDWIRD